jgi:hypothetical protein
MIESGFKGNSVERMWFAGKASEGMVALACHALQEEKGA